MPFDLMSLFRSRSSGPVSRCRFPDERRGSWRADADRGNQNAACKPAKLDGTKLDGPRPPRAAIDCLAAALRAEQVATKDLAAARENVRDCLSAARRDGSSYSSVAAALVRPKSTISETLVARRRMASALACRAHEARKRLRAK